MSQLLKFISFTNKTNNCMKATVFLKELKSRLCRLPLIYFPPLIALFPSLYTYFVLFVLEFQSVGSPEGLR